MGPQTICRLRNGTRERNMMLPPIPPDCDQTPNLCLVSGARWSHRGRKCGDSRRYCTVTCTRTVDVPGRPSLVPLIVNSKASAPVKPFVGLLTRINGLPIQLHVDDEPAASLRLIQGLVRPSDVRLTIVGVFAQRIGVMHDAHQTRTTAGRRPLQHLKVAVRVAEGEDRAAADEPVDADRLAGFIVDELGPWLLYPHRRAPH